MVNSIDLLSKTEKITLALIGIDDKPLKGKVWYQKELFLISKLDEELSDELEFEPHHYGPHSYDAEYKLENLESEGYIEIISNEIYITVKGQKLLKQILKEIEKHELNFVVNVKNFLNDLSRMELLAFIYQSNRKMTIHSVELENVLKNKIHYALMLFKKEKISLGKASEIAELSPDKFVKKLKDVKLYVETGI